MEKRAHLSGIDAGDGVTDGVRARPQPSQELLSAASKQLLEVVQTPFPKSEEEKEALEDAKQGDLRPLPAVADPRQKTGKVVASSAVGEQASKRGFSVLPMAKSLNADLGELQEERPDLLVPIHPFPDLFLPGLGDVDHVRPSPLPHGEIPGSVQLSPSAAASGLAALALHVDEGTVGEPQRLVEELAKLGEETSFVLGLGRA
jgi:hypothetical protein